MARIAAEASRGEPFAAAFRAATGDSLGDFEAGFWRRFRWRYRWVPFLTSGATLWLGVTALALLAMARRRQRDAAIRRRWEEEEAEGEWHELPSADDEADSDGAARYIH